MRAFSFRRSGRPPTLPAMTPPSLWQRIRSARIVQVLLVYLGASWAVLQISDTLTQALSLPEWVSPAAVILLLVGLVIILATAWVQSLPSTTAAEEAGERPSDWEIAPTDAVESLKRGSLPYLTWGRSILGGVVALSILFGGAGLYVGLTGRSAVPGLGPMAAGAAEAPEGIAILPFNVSGVDDRDFWGEGMVDLLSTNLDGMGGYRTIDSRTVLARWREEVGDDPSPDLRTALQAAGRTGARYAVVGSAVGVGADLRLVAEIYDLSDGREIGSGQVQGSEADPLSLIDDLSLETMRRLLSGSDENLATSRNLADVTTPSVPALRAYLEGERYYREALFPQAVEAYERALAADSTFALALFRISDAYGWLESVQSEDAIDWAERSVRFMGELSPRNAVIVGASNALYRGDLTAVASLEEAVRRYPDDPEAWFMLAESYIHLTEATGAGPAEALEAVNRAIRLDPGFAPYYVHAIDLNMVLSRPDSAGAVMERYERFSGAESLQAEYLAAYDYYFGGPDGTSDRWSRVRALDDMQLSILWGTFGIHMEDMVRSMRLAEYIRDRTGQAGWWPGIARFSLVTGNLLRAEAMVRDSLPSGPDPYSVYLLHRFGDVDMTDLLDVVRDCAPGPGCTLWRGALAADEGNWAELDRLVTLSRSGADSLRSAGDSLTARFAETDAGVLDGYGRLRRGELTGARTALDAAQGMSAGNGDTLARILLGEVNEALGRTEEAIRWYGLLRASPMRNQALARRARLAEEAGDLETARRDWGMLATSLREADAGYPLAAEATEAVARLGGAG